MPESRPDEPEQPAGSSWQRVRAALRAPSRNQAIVAVLLAVLGFGAVTQVRVNGTDDSYAGARQQDLIDVLNGLAGARQRAEADISHLEKVRDRLRDDTTKRTAALGQAQQEVDQLEVLAGLVPVTGPGIRITITEETGHVRLSSLLDTVEELRTVGAEAMQVNGKVRIVAQSAFEEVDGGFDVDDQLVEPPYVIDVIGDPDVLEGAMNFALGPKQQLEDDGARIKVDQVASLDVQAVATDDQTHFAVPDDDQ